MQYMNISQLKNLMAGREYLRQLGAQTPEEFADAFDLDVKYVRECLSLAKRERDDRVKALDSYKHHA